MRTFPGLQVKEVEELVPGELVVADLGQARVPAIFSRYHSERNGEAPLLIYLISPPDQINGPFYCFTEDRQLSLGSDYVVVIDPIALPARADRRRAGQLIVTRDQRLLQVWDQQGQFELTLDIDTGKTETTARRTRYVECYSWEIRLKMDGVPDFRSPPLFRWDPSSVGPKGADQS